MSDYTKSPSQRRPGWKTALLMLWPLPIAIAARNLFLVLIGPAAVLASDWMERRWGAARRASLAQEIYEHEHKHEGAGTPAQ